MTNREVLNNLLLEIRRVASEIDFEFFLLHGTLLGYYRDKQSIPWDDDIDLGCILDGSNQDLRKLITGSFTKLGYTHWIKETPEWPGACNVVFAKVDSPSFAFKFIKRIADRAIESSSRVTYPWEAIKPLEQVKYLGQKFHIPNNPECLFDIWYGKDSWKTPSRPRWILKHKEPIELYPDQAIAYRARGVVEALLECDKDGNLIKPYVRTGETPRGK